MSVVNVLVKTALDYIQLNNPVFFSSVNREGLESSLQTSLEETLPKKFTLQSDKPDFEDILYAFVQELQTDKAWKDIVQTGTGQTLLRNTSAGISYLHFALVRAVQNSLLLPGTSKDSIYQGMNFLGVNVRRRIPNRIRVRLTIPDHTTAFSIPRFTPIIIDNELFFNREEITYSVFEMVKEVILYQGTVFSRQGPALGVPFETIEIGYENYAVSNEDVYVSVNGEWWSADAKMRPWMAERNQEIVFIKTLETGNVEIKFGNGLYAKKLNAGDILNLVWAETKGAEAALISSETNFTIDSLSLTINGLTLSSTFGGDGEVPLEVYSNIGPHLMASSGVGIRRSDFKALALQYPNIRDAIFRGQAEFAPGLRTFQNTVMVTLLTNGEDNQITDEEWTAFAAYIEERSTFSLRFSRLDPVIIPIRITATVYCNTRAGLDEVASVLKNKLIASTSPKAGVLGYSVYASDNITLLEGNFDSSNGTDYRKVIEYVSGFTFDYTDAVPENDAIRMSEEYGINEDGDAVIAGYNNYIRIDEVVLDLQYTPRRTYFGRTDISSAE